MKRIILYAIVFFILIALFRFVSTRVDTRTYGRVERLEEWSSAAPGKSPRELLVASLESYGGIEKIGSIEEISLKNKIKVFDQEGREVSGQSTEYYRFPDQVRVNFRFDTDEITHLYNGLEAWTITQRGKAKAPDYLSEGLRRSVKHFPTTLLLSALDERSLLTPVDSRTHGGRMVYSVEITDRENDYSNIWIDGETLLLSQIEYVLYSTLGADTMTIVISDYRPVGGIQTAFMARILYNGERAQETLIEEVRYNPDLPDSFFTLRGVDE